MDEINRLLDEMKERAYKCGYWQAQAENAIRAEDEERCRNLLSLNTKLGQMLDEELREELVQWKKKRG